MGTVFQSSLEFAFKLFRFTVLLAHLEQSPFAQASAHMASANAKKSKSQYLGQVPIGTKIKISET